MSAPTIVFDADPFCFGPISTTLNIVEDLRLRGNLPDRTRFVLLGTLTSSQLGRRSGLFDSIYECNTTDPKDLDARATLLTNAALFVSNTNPASISAAARLGIQSVYVDTLFWMWNDLPADLALADKVFIQHFHGIEENIERLRAVVSDPQVVAPILSPTLPDPTDDTDGLLITLGGIDTVYADTGRFWFEFLKDLLALPSVQSEAFVTIAGGGHTIGRLAQALAGSHPNLEIGCFNKQDFLRRLRDARKVLANPGLTTFYECQALNKDVFFLPPQNYSQQLQLQTYLHDYYSPEQGFPWNVHHGYPPIPRYLPEQEGIALIAACAERFLSLSTERARAMAMIETFLGKSPSGAPSAGDSSLQRRDTSIVSHIEAVLAEFIPRSAPLNSSEVA
ncbi:Uncharacterised protein [Bordetella ansorpii]|uniref:Glycosyltransferase n=1 Tax=Bordetella ansorpii TaxID=288768 RepID=A0A157QM40_9BORD|nr:hypothetical protein [Bordetella ansorpii]SAI46992.1 Uncharacterised protein [Bordetella ansorpii]